VEWKSETRHLLGKGAGDPLDVTGSFSQGE
jgi:hypothetical protein